MKLLSPCISICQMDPAKEVCVGCYRTRSEIARWSAMSGEEQQLLLNQLIERKTEQTGIRRRQNRRKQASVSGP